MRHLFLLLFIGCVVSGSSQTFIKDSIFFEADQSYRQYQVWLPNDYAEDKVYHTIYCFDAELLFNVLVANVELYSDPFIAKLPPAIVVGLYFDHRNDDMGIQWEEGELNENGLAFKAMVEEQLVAEVEERYAVSEYRTIVGHSNSTTFAHFFLWDKTPLFSGFLTMSQFGLEKDSLRLANLNVPEGQSVDFVYTSAEADAAYRIESGARLERLLNGFSIDRLNATHIQTKGDHLTMVMHGLPQGLEVLYQSFGHVLYADSILEQFGEVLKPLDLVDSLVNERGVKYGVKPAYTMEDLNALFDLYVHNKDSVGIHAATTKYAEMYGDSSEYFYEAQCLEMMGAYNAAEKAYIRHLNYYCCPGYWSYIRLAWLYRVDLNQPEKALEWAVNGFNDLQDPRFLQEFEKLAKTNAAMHKKVLAVLKKYKRNYTETKLLLQLDECIRRLTSA